MPRRLLAALAALVVVLLFGSLVYLVSYGNANTRREGCYGDPPGLIHVDRDTHWKWWWPPRWYCRYKRPGGRTVELSY